MLREKLVLRKNIVEEAKNFKERGENLRKIIENEKSEYHKIVDSNQKNLSH